MSCHEGVSCDVCLKNNFKGRRYKCLICYDYDLCASCYESQSNSMNHSPNHPMQCIITRSDFEFYYGGENLTTEQPQAFVCPLCGKMGFTEAKFHAHVTSEHPVDSNSPSNSQEVVCPICASLPGGDPNHLTDDLSSHLALEHRNSTRESSARHAVRRISHGGRGISCRTRRSNINFNRDSMDPIAELLSQLSGVRRTTGQGSSSASSQLQQIQMQLQFERQQASSNRQQFERLPRRQGQLAVSSSVSGTTTTSTTVTAANTSTQSSSSSSVLGLQNTPLISRCIDFLTTEEEQEKLEVEHANRSIFVQELLLGTLSDSFANLDWSDLIPKDSSTFPSNRNLVPNDGRQKIVTKRNAGDDEVRVNDTYQNNDLEHSSDNRVQGRTPHSREMPSVSSSKAKNLLVLANERPSSSN